MGEEALAEATAEAATTTDADTSIWKNKTASTPTTPERPVDWEGTPAEPFPGGGPKDTTTMKHIRTSKDATAAVTFYLKDADATADPARKKRGRPPKNAALNDATANDDEEEDDDDGSNNGRSISSYPTKKKMKQILSNGISEVDNNFDGNECAN